MKILLTPVILLAGCSASVATSNPACIIMCQNTGDISTKEKQNEAPIPTIPSRPVQ